LRTRTLTYTAVDACNNSSTCTQVISWTVDTTPPVFTNCPASTNLGCNPTNVPGCNPAVGATDGCSTPTVSCASVDATNGCLRTRTLTYTAVDGCNNSNTCTQVITWTVDTTPPVFVNCPTPAFTNMGCNPDPASIPFCRVSVTATDNCGAAHVTCSLVQTTNLLTCERTRTITYTATDDCGNTATCTQVAKFTVDTTPPIFTKSPPASTNLGCNPASIPVCDTSTNNVIVTDDCSSTPTITCGSVDTTNGCGRTRTLTYTATGGCGNTATKTTVITWTVDTVPPVFTLCPTNMSLGCNPASIPDCDTSTNNVRATDNCGTPTITCAKVDTTNGCSRTRTITYTAKDACNNSNTCVQVITWTLDTPPVLGIVLQGTNVVISWAVPCNPYVLEQTPSLNPPITWSPGPGPIVPVGNTNTVTVPVSPNNMFYRLRYP
jgi:hypothetical protein